MQRFLLIFTVFLSTQFTHAHPVFNWLDLEEKKPKKVICLNGNKMNGRVIMLYSVLSDKLIDYCYMGDVVAGKPTGMGSEFFKIDGIGFNRQAIIENQNFALNGFYLEIRSEFTKGSITGQSELIFYKDMRFQHSALWVERVQGSFCQSDIPDNVLHITFSQNNRIISYRGTTIGKEVFRLLAERVARTGNRDINYVQDLTGTFEFSSEEVFKGICDKYFQQKHGTRQITSNDETRSYYIDNYEIYPVHIVHNGIASYYVLTDGEGIEIKRSEVIENIDVNNIASYLEIARNSIFRDQFVQSRSLISAYKVFKTTETFNVLLKLETGVLTMKIQPKNSNEPKPVISWERNMIVPLDTAFNPKFRDGYFYWWDSVYNSGNSVTNELSWKLYDSIHGYFLPEYFGFKLTVTFPNGEHKLEIPCVFSSEAERNFLKKRGAEVSAAYQKVQKEREAKEKIRKQEQEAKRLALQRQQEETRKAQEVSRSNKLKDIQKGDVLCYSQGWEYSEGFWVFYESGKFDMIATLIVDDISPSGNVIFIVNNVASSSENRYQSMKYGNLVIKEGQKISATKIDLINDNRFQFCN